MHISPKNECIEKDFDESLSPPQKWANTQPTIQNCCFSQ